MKKKPIKLLLTVLILALATLSLKAQTKEKVKDEYFFNKGSFTAQTYFTNSKGEEQKDALIKYLIGDGIFAAQTSRRGNISQIITIDTTQNLYFTIYPSRNSLTATFYPSGFQSIEKRAKMLRFEVEVKETKEKKEINGYECTKWTLTYQETGYKYHADVWLTSKVKKIQNGAFIFLELFEVLNAKSEAFPKNAFVMEITATLEGIGPTKTQRATIVEIDTKAKNTLDTKPYK